MMSSRTAAVSCGDALGRPADTALGLASLPGNASCCVNEHAPANRGRRGVKGGRLHLWAICGMVSQGLRRQAAIISHLLANRGDPLEIPGGLEAAAQERPASGTPAHGDG